ncbi:MAG: hypothetical protein ACLFSC_01615 [Wenzhouxiangella sp.]
MTRLTDEERHAMTELARQGATLSNPVDSCRIVEPTPEARMAFIRFATTASLFYRGSKEVGFKGDNWRL